MGEWALTRALEEFLVSFRSKLQKLIQEFTVLFYLNVFFLLRTWPAFTKKPRNLKAIWTSKIRCMNRALMVGVLTPPQSLIL